MVEQKRYGLRVYKDKEPCVEYTYYSLKEIYEESTKCIDKKDLSNKIGDTLKEKFPAKYDQNSTYTAEIVFYPNKKETEKIAKKAECGKFISNGVTSKLLPILYSDNINVLNDKYIENRFVTLMSKENSDFRNRLFELYDSSMVEAKDKDGNPKDKSSFYLFRNVLDVINVFETKGKESDVMFNIGKLYNKISNGFAERTKIYVIMETEFPVRKIPEPKTEQTEVDDRIEVPFIVYLQLLKEDREKFKMGPMQEGDTTKLLDIALNGKLLPGDKPKQR